MIAATATTPPPLSMPQLRNRTQAYINRNDLTHAKDLYHWRASRIISCRIVPDARYIGTCEVNTFHALVTRDDATIYDEWTCHFRVAIVNWGRNDWTTDLIPYRDSTGKRCR